MRRLVKLGLGFTFAAINSPYPMSRAELEIDDFNYELPDERIAKYALDERDQCKLLLFDRGQISHGTFSDLAELLDGKNSLVFNNSRVIAARLQFKHQLQVIEVFLLHPLSPSNLLIGVMDSKEPVVWECLVGNKRKWPEGQALTANLFIHGQEVVLNAELLDAETMQVRLSWNDDSLVFSEILDLFGQTPLPPYLKRVAEDRDRDDYQTVYAAIEGSVAAPTAGLHFTPRLLKKLSEQGIAHIEVTLHVSAGTFLPVKVQKVVEHTMHEEQLVLTREALADLQAKAGRLIVVGTTSLRTVESVYWFGVKLLNGWTGPFYIHQEDAYQDYKVLPSGSDAIAAVLRYLDQHDLGELTGETQLFIMPGYKSRMVKGIITNFHQPKSTLLLLIAALIGEDWKRVYDEAMQNDYRFLSYGDSSLLLF